MVKEFEAFLESAFTKGKDLKTNKADWLEGEWSGFSLPIDEDRRGKTGVAKAKLKELGDAITRIPENVDVHKTVERVIARRRESYEAGKDIDWGGAEHLAFASLLDEGFPVRLSGQIAAAARSCSATAILSTRRAASVTRR